MRRWIFPLMVSVGLLAPLPVAATEAEEALHALQALQSTTRIGVTYQEYQRRLIDTAIIVDRFLKIHNPSEGELRARLGMALALYQQASTWWEARIILGIGGARSFLAHARANRNAEVCPEMRDLLGRTPEDWEHIAPMEPETTEQLRKLLAPGRADALTLHRAISALWICASSEIEHAERLVGR